MIWRDCTVMVTLPAKTVAALTALAGGYSMSRGEYLSRSVIGQVDALLEDNGYTHWDDEPFPEARDWITR